MKPPSPISVRYRPLSRPELDLLLDWAAGEGWNPGLHDAAAFHAADPEGFWGIEHEGTLIGAASIVAYEEGEGAFVGLYIVCPEWRGQGHGTRFWHFFIQRLRERIQPGGWIGLDGVFAMQAAYAKSGFVFTHRNLRMEGVGQANATGTSAKTHRLTPLGDIPFHEVAAFDRRHFGASRTAFLERWIRPQGGLALGSYEASEASGTNKAGRLRGYGVIRPCREGYKIGPLFAENAEVAETLFTALSHHAAGERLALDIPERNRDALALAATHGLEERFGCARMILGPVPNLPWEKIYGITTFELG